eukprot:ctg_1893.g512
MRISKSAEVKKPFRQPRMAKNGIFFENENIEDNKLRPTLYLEKVDGSVPYCGACYNSQNGVFQRSLVSTTKPPPEEKNSKEDTHTLHRKFPSEKYFNKYDGSKSLTRARQACNGRVHLDDLEDDRIEDLDSSSLWEEEWLGDAEEEIMEFQTTKSIAS